jgi:hypothetical protein
MFKSCIRIIFVLTASLMATHALSQDLSGWSDKTVCRQLLNNPDNTDYLEEAKNRGLGCGSGVAKKQSSTTTNYSSNSKVRNVIAKDINFPGKFYTTEIKSCKAMAGSPTFNESPSLRRVKGLVGYDWHADWEANSVSISPKTENISEPIKVFMAATQNAIGNDNQANIKTAKNLLIDLAKADTLYDSIGYYDVKKKPLCYADGDPDSPCWFHQYSFASDVFAHYMITALWLKDELNEQEFKVVDQYMKKMYKKFLQPKEFQKEDQGFYGMANGGLSILSYASWTNNKKLAAKEMNFRFKEMDRLFYEDGYINNNSFRGTKALWYHSMGLNVALSYVYIADLWGAEVPTKLQKKLVRASKVTNLAITDWDTFTSRKYSGTQHNKISSKDSARLHTNNFTFALGRLMKIVTNVELENDAVYLQKRKYRMRFGIDETIGFNPNCTDKALAADNSPEELAKKEAKQTEATSKLSIFKIDGETFNLTLDKVEFIETGSFKLERSAEYLKPNQLHKSKIQGSLKLSSDKKISFSTLVFKQAGDQEQRLVINLDHPTLRSLKRHIDSLQKKCGKGLMEWGWLSFISETNDIEDAKNQQCHYDYFKDAHDQPAWELFQTVLGGTDSILDYLQTNVER